MKMQQLMAGIVASCVAVGTAQAGLVIRPADDERAIVTSDGDDEVIIVKTNTTLTVSGSGTIDLLVVGGGGGGGARYGGGGGGGAVVYRQSVYVSAGSYDVVVGQGGAYGTVPMAVTVAAA